MKILFLDAYYEPERIAFTHLESDLLDCFVQNGHKVEIICPTPTRGIDVNTKKQYKKIKSEYIYNGNVHVTRFYAPQEHKHPLFRTIRYLWCNLRSFQIGKRIEKVDAVFCNSTPPTQGWIAGRVAKNHNVPFVYSLQDIFPDSLVSTGMTKRGSLMWTFGRKLENSTYNLSNTIIVISESMKQNLLSKDVSEEKIHVISNWVDIESVHPVPKIENSLFDQYDISRDKFIVLYAGNFGAAQGAGIILDAAEKLEYENSIQFVIFGDGSEFQSANQKAKSLSNVFIHSLLPMDKISEVYSLADVALITCKKGVGNSGMPSKLWSIMACNTSIIASFDVRSDLADVIKESGAGYCVEPGSVDALASAIIKAHADWLNEKKDSNDIREYAIKKASKDVCVQKYINIFQSMDV